MSWGNKYVFRVGTEEQYDVSNPDSNIGAQKKHIEPCSQRHLHLV